MGLNGFSDGLEKDRPCLVLRVEGAQVATVKPAGAPGAIDALHLHVTEADQHIWIGREYVEQLLHWDTQEGD